MRACVLAALGILVRECYAADSNEELFRWFTTRVQRNLHIVFTMNPASADFGNRAATSPALFNRCVVNWMGDWSNRALAQVAHEFTAHVDMDDAEYRPPGDIEARTLLRLGTLRAAGACSAFFLLLPLLPCL